MSTREEGIFSRSRAAAGQAVPPGHFDIQEGDVGFVLYSCREHFVRRVRPLPPLRSPSPGAGARQERLERLLGRPPAARGSRLPPRRDRRNQGKPALRAPLCLALTAQRLETLVQPAQAASPGETSAAKIGPPVPSSATAITAESEPSVSSITHIFARGGDMTSSSFPNRPGKRPAEPVGKPADKVWITLVHELDTGGKDLLRHTQLAFEGRCAQPATASRTSWSVERTVDSTSAISASALSGAEEMRCLANSLFRATKESFCPRRSCRSRAMRSRSSAAASRVISPALSWSFLARHDGPGPAHGHEADHGNDENGRAAKR